MSYATANDVRNRLGRPLADSEESQILALLDDVEVLIKSRIPDLDEKVEANKISVDAVVMVTASSVVRLLRNPEGYTSETDGDYSYQINWRLASGALEILDRDWELLGVKSALTVLHPKLNRPGDLAAASVDPGSVEFAVWSMNSELFWNGT